MNALEELTASTLGTSPAGNAATPAPLIDLTSRNCDTTSLFGSSRSVLSVSLTNNVVAAFPPSFTAKIEVTKFINGCTGDIPPFATQKKVFVSSTNGSQMTVTCTMTGGSVAQTVSGGSISQQIAGDAIYQTISKSTVSQKASGESFGPIVVDTIQQTITGGSNSQMTSGRTTSQTITGGSISQMISGGTTSQAFPGGMFSYLHVAPPWTPKYEITSKAPLSSSGTVDVQLIVRLQNPTEDTWVGNDVRLFDRLNPSLALTANCGRLAPGEAGDCRDVKLEGKPVGPVKMHYFKIWVAQIPEAPSTSQGTLQCETQAKLEYVLVNDLASSDISNITPMLAAPFKLLEMPSGGTRTVAGGSLPSLEFAGYRAAASFDPIAPPAQKFAFRVPSAGAPAADGQNAEAPASIALDYSDIRAGNSPGSSARTVTCSAPANTKDLKYPLLFVASMDSNWNLATSGYFLSGATATVEIHNRN